MQAAHLSLLVRRLTIQAAVAIIPPHAVILQDVQHPGHLTEDEHTRTWKRRTDGRISQRNVGKSRPFKLYFRCV